MFFDHLWSLENFESHLYQGLYDADDKEPYITGRTYLWHFYNDVGRTYLPGPHYTARTAGERYFSVALQAGGEIVLRRSQGTPVTPALIRECAYHLGLALHFLTDVTQPMHTVGFTVLTKPEFLHSAWEKWVDKHLNVIMDGAPAVTTTELDRIEKETAGGWLHFGVYLHAVAARTRALWPLFQKWVQGRAFAFELGDPDVQAILGGSVRLAPSAVSGIIYAMAGLIRTNQTLVGEAKWYRIREFTCGEYLTATDSASRYIERWKPLDGNEAGRQMFCFIPDGAGCYRIVSRFDTTGSWWMSRVSDIIPYHYAKLVPGGVENPRHNAFYLTYAGMFNGVRRIHIVEPTIEEYVTVSWGSSDGRALRWSLGDDRNWRTERQTFELVEAGDIPEAEHARIRQYWSDKIRTPRS